MSDFLPALIHEFRRHKSLADQALAQLEGESFFARPVPHVNSAALIVKHLSGSMQSRWTDFLTSDGDKPDRDRDREFILGSDDTREALLSCWNQGWEAALQTLAELEDSDLQKSVTIRGEVHSVAQALLRGLSHATYHVGQILYVARLLRPEGEWLTIPPGKSQTPRPGYLQYRQS